MNMIKAEPLHVFRQVGLLVWLLLFPRENNTLCPNVAASARAQIGSHDSRIPDPRKVSDK